ncbi:hypothetical protein ABQ039_011870 [Xanthomonas sp. WHRI 6108]|jgi:hypothetical protein|uniref:hypothetical protein n=1 Tax=Xanthomonas TaxID=338 RepID=UPI00161C1773|nr:hypothetical protein [Xanthomonas arboricola]MBB5673735.1 hypothetical protein [Xanthomonas arboricola]
MNRTYQRALAVGWTVVAITAAICVPLRLVELHTAHRSAGATHAVDSEQSPALPHVRLAQAED